MYTSLLVVLLMSMMPKQASIARLLRNHRRNGLLIFSVIFFTLAFCLPNRSLSILLVNSSSFSLVNHPASSVMVAKLSMLNISRWLLLFLVTAAFFSPFSSAEEKFKISKNIKSAKAIVDSDKKFNATIEFNPGDYNFDLSIGGCKLSVTAIKKSQDVTNFEFYNEKGAYLKNSNNPKSFAVTGQELVFKSADGDPSNFPKICDDGFKFVPIEGQNKYTLEIKLDGEIDLELSSDSLIYEQSETEKGNVMLWVWISVGVGSFLFVAIIVGVIITVVCIRRKKKAATAKEMESKEQLKTAINAEETAKEASRKQRPSKEKHSDSKPSKSLKAEKDQKPSVRPSSQEAKPAIETQVQKPAAQETKPAIETQVQKFDTTAQKEKPEMEQKPDPQSAIETALKNPAAQEPKPEANKYAYIELNLKSGERKVLKVEIEPKRDRPLFGNEQDSITWVKAILNPANKQLCDDSKLHLIKKRDKYLAEGDEIYAARQEAKRKRAAEEEAKKKEEVKKQKE